MDYETLLRQPNKAKLIGSGPGTLQGAKDTMDAARQAAVALGAVFPKEAKAATKAVKEALSEQANAFKNEIELIGNLTSNYKKLTDVGYSSVSAIEILTKEYKNSIDSINKVFGKYGIAKFDIGDFAGKNTSEILKMLEKQRALLPKNAKADVKQTLDVEIAKTRIESKTFDLSLITDGLQEQLNNIKESYELGIEIELS